MANLNCKACEDLRNEVPELVAQGFDNNMCASLANDTGLKASSGNNDCTDLDTMNDCLVGNMETEIDRYDTCDWKSFTKKLIDNLWTTLKGIVCAICGLWTNVHSLWTTIRSLCLKKSGNKITLYSNLGDHCSVTDADTTYTLTKSGDTITLTGSDGTTQSVNDADTTYGLSISGNKVTLVEDGTNKTVTIPDNNTTYTLTLSGDQLTLTGSDGSTHTVTVSGQDTWQPNTSTQEGYVKKGEDDPLKVWCTNKDGIPAWRNSPTLGGHLTLMDHDGWIGETKYWELTEAKSIANDSTTATNAKIKTVTLTKGTWVVAATVGYAPNGTGVRALGISFGNAAHRKGTMLPACDSAHETILCKTYIHTVTDDTEDVYLDTYQTSGGALNLMIAPETYVNCVRIE